MGQSPECSPPGALAECARRAPHRPRAFSCTVPDAPATSRFDEPSVNHHDSSDPMPLDDPQEPLHQTPVIRPLAVELIDRRGERVGDAPRLAPAQFRARKRLALFLFAATCLSTFWSGMALAGPRASIGEVLWSGLSYSAPVMLILLAHEMGHYVQARRYRVPATLPYFIPMPGTPFGTMGAVIVQGAGVADRKALFDIAISGPLAGLVLALPVAYVGVRISQVVPLDGAAVMIFGDPPVLKWMITAVHGPQPPGHEVILNPLLFAGWVGIFVTALNLVPIGQLDGGHILYTLIGKRAHAVAIVLLLTAIAAMIYTGYPAYALMVVLLVLMGPRHPPTADDTVPLGTGRIVLGWATLSFLLIGFTLEPIKVSEPPPPPPPRRAPTLPERWAHWTLDAAADSAAARADTSARQRAARWPAGYPSHRDFMKASASRASCSSVVNIRRQILVAAARSGSARPNASTISHPS